MKKTDKLGLLLHGTTSEDLSLTFLQWRQSINGEQDSNMIKIDQAINEIGQKLQEINDAKAQTIESIKITEVS